MKALLFLIISSTPALVSAQSFQSGQNLSAEAAVITIQPVDGSGGNKITVETLPIPARKEGQFRNTQQRFQNQSTPTSGQRYGSTGTGGWNPEGSINVQDASLSSYVELMIQAYGTQECQSALLIDGLLVISKGISAPIQVIPNNLTAEQKNCLITTFSK